MEIPFQYWATDLRGRLVNMFHDALSAETYVRRKSEQLVFLLVKDTRTGHTYKYNPSTADFELFSKRPKLW